MAALKKLLFPLVDDQRISAVLLLLRVFAGVALMTHGWKKIQDPFHWMNNSAAPAPAVFQMLAAVAEFFGGLGLAVGALTVVASFGVFCTMVVAIETHASKGDPFGKWELAAFYACVMVFLAVAGPGRFSFDAWLARRLGFSSK
ncbi:MAG: DoxX family protein [Myxococcaceae bacterium]|nr:DoxX family protein [Myxococcaceae bacterium]